MFFYVYPILFNGIPVSTRIIFSFIGFTFFVYDIISLKKMLVTCDDGYIYSVLFLIFLLSLTSIFINDTADFEFVKYPISFIAILFSASALLRLFKWLNICFDRIFLMKAFILVVFIQSFIALLMYVSPDFYTFFTSIQKISMYESERMVSFSEFRFIGFGSQYFGAGIIHGLALILLAYLTRIGEYDNKTFKVVALFIFIFAIGVGMARTTFIGLGIAILLIFIPNRCLFFIDWKLVKRNLMLLLSFFVVFISLLIVVSLFFPQLISAAKPVIDFAFELFLNYFDSGVLTSASTSHLETMYIFPTNIHTYFIGDGRYYVDDGLYYMGTDVGYLRLLFYFGCFGVFLFIALQYCLLRSAFKSIKSGHLLLIFIFIYVLILNLKGFADLSSILVLFVVSRIYQKKMVS